MPSCDLAIRLEDESGRFRGGDVVRGTVAVTVGAETTCKELSLRAYWQAKYETGGQTIEFLYEGPWRALTEEIYPFEVALPPAPFTREGHLFDIEWVLEARADVPWARDAKVQRTIELAPGPAPPEPDRDAVARAPEAVAALSKAILFAALGFLGLIGLTMLVLPALDDDELLRELQIPGGICVVLALFGMAVTLRNALARRGLGDIRLEIDADRVAPGRSLSWRLEFEPRRSVDLTSIDARLRGRESARVSEKNTAFHVVFDRSEAVADQQALEGGQPFSVAGTCEVPPDAPFSFHGKHHQVHWTLELTVRIAGRPHFSIDRPIFVWPEAGS